MLLTRARAISGVDLDLFQAQQSIERALRTDQRQQRERSMEEERGRRSRAPSPAASDNRDRGPYDPDSRSPSPLSQAFEDGLTDIYRSPRTRSSSESGVSAVDDSDYSPESASSTERSETSSLGLTEALEDLALLSNSGASNTEDSQNEEYNFLPERREALMRQMRRDIARYDVARERAFGQEHGYEVYPSTPEPPVAREKRRRDSSTNSDASLNGRIGRNSAWRAPSPSLTSFRIGPLAARDSLNHDVSLDERIARNSATAFSIAGGRITSRPDSRERDRSLSPARAASVASADRTRRNTLSSSARSDTRSENPSDELRGRGSSASSVLSLVSLRRSRSRGSSSRSRSLPQTPVRMPSPECVDRSPLTSRSRNPVDDFLDELCGNATRADGVRGEMRSWNRDSPGFAHSQGNENESYILSVLRILPEYESSTVDRLHFEEAAERLQDNLQRRLIQAAVADGMDPREAWEFLQAWRLFARDKEWSEVPGMLNMMHMQFWSALRKGWGTERWGIWRPSDRFLAAARTMLLEDLRYPHTPWEGSYAGSSSTDPVASLTTRIADSGLPREEIERLNELFGNLDCDWTRIARIFHSWLREAESVQEQRIAQEASLSIEDIRLDRLERLIREEWLLNGVRSIPRDPSQTRRRRHSWSPSSM